MNHAYDPDLAEWAARLPAANYARPALARAQMAEVFAARPPLPVPADIRVSDQTIAVDDAQPVPVRLYEPLAREGTRAALLYIHGGGFVLGDLEMAHPRAMRFAEQLGIVVVSVDYRLAPDHPFPAGLLDCFTVLAWLAASAGELGVDAARIGVAGDSAGAGLAAGLAALARDRGVPRIRFQHLDFPALDDRRTSESARTLTDTPNIDAAALGALWRHYLSGAGNGLPLEYAAPARIDDLSGLPPACVVVSQFDPVRDEGIEYARRLAQAGVPTELHLYPGTFHGSGIVADAAVSRRMVADQLAAVARGLVT